MSISGFKLNMFWNGRQIIKTSSNKTNEKIDLAPKNPQKSTVFDELLILNYPLLKIEVLHNKPQYITNIHRKFQDFIGHWPLRGCCPIIII